MSIPDETPGVQTPAEKNHDAGAGGAANGRAANGDGKAAPLTNGVHLNGQAKGGEPCAAGAWASKAKELTLWAWDRFVNRTDVWGGYNSPNDRGKKYTDADGKETELGSTLTRPGKRYRGKVILTKKDVWQHFRATGPEHVVGLHTTSAENTSRWGAAEVDWHGEGGNPPEVNLAAALGWYRKLAGRGFHPLLTDSNGRGGYHLRILFNEPVATPLLFYFLKETFSDFARYDLSAMPETFPKQKCVAVGACKGPQYGNWLRLPGRHHTRDHWARVWDGSNWLEGTNAVDFMLALTGDPPSLVPEDAEVRVGIAAYLAKLPHLGEGQGRDDVAFNFACFLVRDKELSDEKAHAWLTEWDSGNTPPKGDARLWEIIAGAHKYGQHAYGSGNGKQGKPGKNGRGGQSAKASDGKPTGCGCAFTDTGNAERLALRHGLDLRHCHPWNKWLCWDNRRWAIDETGEVIRRAVDTVRAINAEAKEAEDADAKEAIYKHAAKSESAKLLHAMIGLARAKSSIPILPASMDGDPWLLNVLNGTIDLRTGLLRDHQRGDLLTKLCPTGYYPDETCPHWIHFLGAVFKQDASVITFIQRLFGHALTGDVSEDVFTIFWGGGSNGKTTLLDTIRHVLGGDYAMRARAEILMKSQGERHPTEMADLFGRRLVVTSEGQQGGRLNEALVKDLTGGGRIRARRMREDSWEFDATHKIILETNYRPRIMGTDEGIRRRLRLIPFGVHFWDPDKHLDPAAEGLDLSLKADKHLDDKLKAEAAGILAWMVQGCLGWQREGLPLPEAVRAETGRYIEDEDVVGRWLEECCTTAGEKGCKASILYGSYRWWCETNGEDEYLTKKMWGESMTERGYERYTNNGVWYRGVKTLLATDEKPGSAASSDQNDAPATEGRKDTEGSSCYPP